MADTASLAAVAVATDLLTALSARLTEYRAVRDVMTADMARIENAISLIENNVPAHQWVGTALRIQNPDGSLSDPVDLRGLPGPTPAMEMTFELGEAFAEAAFRWRRRYERRRVSS